MVVVFVAFRWINLSSRLVRLFLFFLILNLTTTKIYSLSLHDALPIFAARLRGPIPGVVARGARDPVLAPHRARAAPGAGDRGPHAVRVPGAHEYRATVVPAARAASVLQQCGVHPDDGGHVLPPVPERP